MASSQAEKLRDLYLRWGEETAENARGGINPLSLLRYQHNGWGDLGSEPEGVCYRDDRFGTLGGIWALPVDARKDRVILYFHGGGYISGTAKGVRKLLGHIAKASATLGFALEYRLAPEHAFPAALEDALAAYDWLEGRGFLAANIVVGGDSAGGALATALVLKLKELGRPLPAAIIGLSPFYDVEYIGPSFDANLDKDAMATTREQAQALPPLFLGASGLTTANRFVNALQSDPTGLPPVILSYGGFEVLVSGGEMFASLARAKGVEVELEVVPEMQHVFHYACGFAPEADASIARIGEFVRRHGGSIAP